MIRRIMEFFTYFKRPKTFPVKAYVPLSEEERKRFQEILADPVFVRVIDNAYCKIPSVNAPGTGAPATREPCIAAGNNRLHQIQGWYMFEAAIFSQAEQPILRNREQVKENYPDAGNTIVGD